MKLHKSKNEDKSVKSPGLISIFKNGDIFTKLSFVIMGLSNMVRGQVVKGIAYLAMEAAYIFYMYYAGIYYLGMLRTLGTTQQGMVFNEDIGIYEMTQGDNSMLLLLYGVVSIVLTAAFVAMWYVSIKSGEEARQLKISGKKVPGFIDEV